MSDPAHWNQGERAILAVLLQQPRTVGVLQLTVEESDFYRPANGELFATICAMVDELGPENFDPILLSQRLISTGRLNALGGPGYLAELATQGDVLPSNVSYYATRVRELSRVRRFRQMLERGLQTVEETERGWWRESEKGHTEVDLDRLQTAMAHVMLEGDLLVDEKMMDEKINGLSTWSDFLSVPDKPSDWLVRDMIERQDVWMILGGEGGGKSWFSRQMVLTLGSGIDPFRWDERIPPVRTLLIDLENAESMVRRQSRPIYHQALRLGDDGKLNEHTYIWRRPEGLNLRERRDQLLLQTVLDRVRPEFVAMGSLYNSFRKGNDDWETAAEDVKEFLNKMRTRYSCAWLLEHHMPKGTGDDRPQTPYGSSVWMRWVTHGYVMHRVGTNLWTFNPFRGARDARTIPAGLQRGGTFPWAPIWGADDLDAMIELEGGPLPRGRRRA